MRRPSSVIPIVSCLVATLVAGAVPASGGTADLEDQVRRTETAFAKTMADRDHAAFTTFLSDEAVFVGSKGPTRGKAAIAEQWKRYYEGTKAPFAWAADRVVVLDSGTLALSSGPVLDPAGQRIGTFNSVWRRESEGTWKIVLDNGCPECDCGPPKPDRKPKGR